MTEPAKPQEVLNGAAPAVQPLEPGSVPAAPNIIVTELEFAKNKRTKNGKLRMSTFNGHPFLEAPRQARWRSFLNKQAIQQTRKQTIT